MAAAFPTEFERDWIKHDGGGRPPAAKGLRCDLKFRNGKVELDTKMTDAVWRNMENFPSFDVVCWRPAADQLLPPDWTPLPAGDDPYASLREVLDMAFEQASAGKGKERHAVGDTPFEQQPMSTINRQLGSVHGFIYQAHKKSLEAMRLPDGRAQAELLGAINYLAGAVIALDTWAKKDA